MKKSFKRHFLDEYRSVRRVFVRPNFHWYFGPWWKEGNLPIWRRGPQIILAKNSAEYDTEYDFAKLINSSWTELGKKNHPILSKIFKHPVIQFPYWLSFYFFNSDIMYKTKWEEDDFRYEFPSHITLVFFGLALSVTAYIPQLNKKDFTCQDDYWEALLTYKYYGGDLEKVNEVMGYYGSFGESDFKWRFQSRFLKNSKQQEELISIQQHQANKLKYKRVYAIKSTEIFENGQVKSGIVEYDNTPLVYRSTKSIDEALANLKTIHRNVHGLKSTVSYSKINIWAWDIDTYEGIKLYKSAIVDKEFDMLKNVKHIDAA